MEDKSTRGIRDAIYGPLYPLAEWIATNWWALLYEVASPTRLAGGEYVRRHNTAAASEGFALPSLRVQPEGERILLYWEPVELPDHRLQFLSRGHKHLDRAEVEEAFRRFVGAVIARLQDQGVSDTLLADEWAAIENTDAEERAFCKAAGQLGWDPYALSQDAVDMLVASIDQLPANGVVEEFLMAADGSKVLAQGQALRRFLGVTEEDIQVIAARFGTSEYVIHYQINNHRLARVEPWGT